MAFPGTINPISPKLQVQRSNRGGDANLLRASSGGARRATRTHGASNRRLLREAGVSEVAIARVGQLADIVPKDIAGQRQIILASAGLENVAAYPVGTRTPAMHFNGFNSVSCRVLGETGESTEITWKCKDEVAGFRPARRRGKGR